MDLTKFYSLMKVQFQVNLKKKILYRIQEALFPSTHETGIRKFSVAVGSALRSISYSCDRAGSLSWPFCIKILP
jgi:hypothetical protein